MDKIKLFLDEDVHAALGVMLQKRGFDVEHAQQSNRKGRSDIEQLKWAVQQKRCLVTFNVKDYVQIHNQYVQQGQEHWGIIVSKHIPIGNALRRILNVLQIYTPKSMKNRFLFLPKVDTSI